MKRILGFILLAAVLTQSEQSSDSSQNLEILINNGKNASGHWNLNFTIGGISSDIKHTEWTFKLNYVDTIHDGKEEVHVQGDLFVPPSPPADYVYFPGIGYYQFYSNITETFENAELICEKSGGHLAIINSEAEAAALASIYAPYVGEGSFARLGFDDRYHKGEFRTIYGEPLSSTGYVKWAANEPDLNNDRNCGCMNKYGLLGAQICTDPRLFLCEFDLSWAGGLH